MTEHRPPWPADKKAVDKGIWQGYGPLDTDAEVRVHFIKKFGYPPKEIKRNGGCVRVGPIREGER